MIFSSLSRVCSLGDCFCFGLVATILLGPAFLKEFILALIYSFV